MTESFTSDCVQNPCSVLCVHAHDFFWARWFTIWKYMHILNCLIDINILQNCFINIDIDIFKNDHIDINIDILQKCWYINNHRLNWWTDTADWRIQVMEQQSNLFRKTKTKNQNCHMHFGQRSPETLVMCYWVLQFLNTWYATLHSAPSWPSIGNTESSCQYMYQNWIW